MFRLNGDSVDELEGQSVAVEKSIQDLFERHLETFLAVRFLASEYTTGKRHAVRIDTLGIDENHSPVIIEYNRSVNEKVINQWLYMMTLDDDVQMKIFKHYIAFKRIKNFACVEIHPQTAKVLLYLKV